MVLWLVPAVLIVAYCVFDRTIAQAAIVIGMSTGATYVALRGARRGNRTYWLIVAALGLWAAGWIGWQGTILATGSVPTTSSLDNLLFLGGDAALLLALVVALCRRERSLVGLLDVSTIAASLLVVAWASLLHKYTAGSLPKFGRGLQIAYGTFDVLLVAAGLRLLVAPRLRAGGGALLVGAAGALVASDFFWNWGTAFDIYVPGSWADAGWLIFAVLGALAARRCTQDVTAEVDGERQARHHTVGRVTLLGISALVCPLVFVVEVLVDDVDAWPLVVGGAVIALFVVAGFAVLLRQASTFHARAGEIASLVDSTADAVIGTTPNGIITSWNHGAELIYGWAAAEAVGRPLVMIVPPATRGLVAESMHRLAQGTTAIRHTATGLHRDGHEIHVDLTVCPVFASGRLIAVSTMARDISSHVRAEAERERLLDELASQNEQLREFDRLKDEFVASVSHELRTPLTSIRGYLELMRDDQVLDEEHEGMLGIVDRNAERLLGLVNDLLFAAQVAAGSPIKLAFEQFDLADVVTDAVAAAAPRAEHGGVALEVEAEPEPLQGDATRIAQVADNLISNAIKFTPPGGTVRVALSSDADDVVLTVSDSGMGIAADEQTDLFSRFHRTKAAKKGAIPGTGLGLSIVKSIVAAHGGTVTFESTVGAGTTFVVTLPRAPVALLSTAA
ncbi:MAG: PAS domain-containing sensor histidine kinase [Actinomycetota bacterium]|nr:PAS domain-containing sensor histidine kinase [Actinomycetota bacterium]